MKPTCANSTSANAIDTLRNATSHKASARTFDAGNASVAASSAAVPPRAGGRPTKITTMGIVSTSIVTAAAIMALENPKRPMATTNSGTPTMPPKLAPLSARLIAMPRFRSNQRPSVLVMMARLVPAQPNANSASAR